MSAAKVGVPYFRCRRRGSGQRDYGRRNRRQALHNPAAQMKRVSRPTSATMTASFRISEMDALVAYLQMLAHGRLSKFCRRRVLETPERTEVRQWNGVCVFPNRKHQAPGLDLFFVSFSGSCSTTLQIAEARNWVHRDIPFSTTSQAIKTTRRQAMSVQEATNVRPGSGLAGTCRIQQFRCRYVGLHVHTHGDPRPRVRTNSHRGQFGKSGIGGVFSKIAYVNSKAKPKRSAGHPACCGPSGTWPRSRKSPSSDRWRRWP